MRVGYIGLGIMGTPMALNIIKAGFELTVWARREAACAPLVEAGATQVASPAALAAQVDLVFTNVSDTPDVEEVILGAEGIIHGAHPGLIVVDNSTISPDASREIAARLAQVEVDFLDAPVSGGDVGAKAGTLSIMVGGQVESFNKVLPVLQACGQNIVHIGAVGAGQVCKACNQVLVAQQMAAVGEALMLAKAMEADPAKVREALLGGFAQSRILDIHGQRILDNNFAPGFKARLHNKDMHIALHAATSRGLELPGATLAAEHIAEMVDSGLGEEDSSAMCKVIARHSDFELY